VRSPSLLFPISPHVPELVAPFAALVHKTSARRLWMGQSLALETHQVYAFLAGAGLKVPMGTGVTLLPLRHPFEAAIQARSVAMLTGHPFVAGFGVSHPAFVRCLRPEPYASPRTAVHEYLTMVRGLLDGDQVEHEGEYHVLRSNLLPVQHPPIELGVGVLRPGMARTAGAVADVAITWMTPPEYIAERLVPALEAGAGERKPPRVATVVHVAVERDGRDPRELAGIAAAGHLSAEHYTDMLRRAGVPADPSDPAAGAAQLVEHGVFVYGSQSEIADQLARYEDATVDEVILNAAGVLFKEGVDAALADLQEILAAVEARDD
jgi:alkanesulfonate monooxygenase SsuD/methylene tetrahydromethanopterin reductase-like flavin-dependent oxidoreductase (luciferase family)